MIIMLFVSVFVATCKSRGGGVRSAIRLMESKGGGYEARGYANEFLGETESPITETSLVSSAMAPS